MLIDWCQRKLYFFPVGLVGTGPAGELPVATLGDEELGGPEPICRTAIIIAATTAIATPTINVLAQKPHPSEDAMKSWYLCLPLDIQSGVERISNLAPTASRAPY